MGLSTKQVSNDGQGWNQALLQANTLELAKPCSTKKQASQQQLQGEAMKCPRCDSTNTKFCYYNNYNKSQPRHYCKACKRHWTKGGTLRNVPVGGGRKNKRKTTNSSSKTTSKINLSTNSGINTSNFSGISNTQMIIQAQQPSLSLNLGALKGVDEKIFTQAFYQTVGRQPPCSMPESDLTFYSKSLSENNGGIFMGSTLSLLHNDQDLQFPYSNLASFESNPCSISSTISSIQSPNLYNFKGETVMNDTNMVITSSSMSDHHQQQWQMSNITNNVIDMSSNWGWDDFDKFVSVDADLATPWDDTEIKP